MFFIITNLLKIVLAINGVLYIVYFISSLVFIFLFETLSLIILLCHSEKLKKDNNRLTLSNITLTDINDDVRAFRHDFNNILQSIGGYIETKDLDSLKVYYNELLEDYHHTSNLEYLDPKIINNTSIHTLLVSKYYKSEAKNISLQFFIDSDFSNLHISNYNLSRILGILLDNAIEASEECDEKIINLKCLDDIKNNRNLVIIENTYLNKDIDTFKIFQKSYSTKKNNTGLGLWEVNRILNKHKNLGLFTNKNDKFFIQQLEIYKN